MDNVLKGYMEKQGIDNVNKLTPAEKQTYEEWEKILSTEAKVDDIVKHLEQQIKTLNVELRSAVKGGQDREALWIAARLENYEAIVAILREPKKRRKALIAELQAKL